jgi:AcrR family transcriptional regulator
MGYSDRHGGKKRRSYHHGNLREALVQAALDLIARNGVAGFTFADAARAAGVSAAAPYRHFRDREALLASVAQRGFEEFGKALSEAWQDGAPDHMAALRRVGRAYLDFSRNEPAYYAAMFESGLPPGVTRELAQAADRAFDVVLEMAAVICAELPAAGRPPARMVALHIWSLSHGIASLFARGDSARRSLPMPADDLLEAGVLIYLQGLGLGRGQRPGN